MDLILANDKFQDLRFLTGYTVDFDIGDTNDFELIVPREDVKEDLKVGNILYVPGKEFGGIIGEIETSSELDTITFRGKCWRGILETKIICPDEGQAYLTYTGDTVGGLRFIVDRYFAGRFTVSGVRQPITYQFKRYVNGLKGIVDMLKAANQKLTIRYVQEFGAGHVELACEPIEIYTSSVSSDLDIGFDALSIQNGVNHLICLGRGELAERQVLHLYVNPKGNVINQQYFHGKNEIVAVFDYPSAESLADLRKAGKEKIRELMNRTSFSIHVNSTDFAASVGDIVGGIDYATGIEVMDPIYSIVYRIEDGEEGLEVTLESEANVNDDDEEDL